MCRRSRMCVASRCWANTRPSRYMQSAFRWLQIEHQNLKLCLFILNSLNIEYQCTLFEPYLIGLNRLIPQNERDPQSFNLGMHPFVIISYRICLNNASITWHQYNLSLPFSCYRNRRFRWRSINLWRMFQIEILLW